MCPGNATPCAEANLHADAHAGDQVLGADWPVTLIGLDVTQRVLLDDDILASITSGTNAGAKLLRAAIAHYRSFYRRTNGIAGILCHDPTAVACLLRPELFGTRSWPVRVETDGLGRGKTWPDLGATDHPPRPWQGRPRIRVALDVDPQAVARLIGDRLTC